MSAPPPPPRRRAHVDVSTAPPPPPVNPAARAARRATERDVTSETGRGPILLILSVVVAMALIGVGVLIALDSDSKKAPPEVDTSTRVDLEVAAVSVVSPSPYLTAEDFPADLAEGVRASLESYVDLATVTPARKGKPVNDAELGTAFDQGAVARIIGTADRDVLLDEGLPKASGRVRVSSPTIDLYGLAEADGTMQLVTAIVQLGIEIESAKGDFTIARVGSIVFAPQSDGTWKITAWALHVDRSGPGLGTTPTTAAPTTSTSAVG